MINSPPQCPSLLTFSQSANLHSNSPTVKTEICNSKIEAQVLQLTKTQMEYELALNGGLHNGHKGGEVLCG